MTIFLAHAEADRTVAEALEAFLERRGQFVELEDGEEAMRPLQSMDVVVALISSNSAFSPWRLRLEARTLEAWADGRLVLVKLDHAFAPVGLRDLPFIDASFEAQRDPFTWGKVADAVREKMRPQAAPAGAASGAPDEVAAPRMPPMRRRAPEAAPAGAGGRLGRLLLPLALILPGLFALYAACSIWLANRIGPSPGTYADLVRGIDALGARVGLPQSVAPILFALAIAVLSATLVYLLLGAFARPRATAGAAREQASDDAADYEAPSAHMPAPAPQPAAGGVFVSYARANALLVLPVIDEAAKQGRKFWLDKDGIAAGESWAGEIVRAIRGARDVMVMCSAAAFESDHVKREVYLADRYNKRLVPVFIEDAQPPEDFEYFFAGVQWLKLHETPEPERPAAVLRALGA